MFCLSAVKAGCLMIAEAVTRCAQFDSAKGNVIARHAWAVAVTKRLLG